MKALKKGVTVFVSIVLWMIILLAALFAFTTLATKDQSQVASVAGFTPMVVKTDSMAPTFEAGDLIMIRKCDTSQLKEGDIVCFHTIIENEYALNTHRIQKIDEMAGVRSYTTKGDNNEISDQHVIADGDIVGKYVGRLPKMGKVMDFLSSSVGFLVVIVLPMLLFFIYQVYHLVMVTISLKKAMAVEEAEQRIAAEEQAYQMQYAAQNGPVMGQNQAMPQNGPMAGQNQAMPQNGPVAGQNQAMPQNGPMAGQGQAMPQNGPVAGQNQPAVQNAPAAEQGRIAGIPQTEGTQTVSQETQQIQSEADAILAEAQRIRAQAEATKAKAEAEAALAEAKRMKADAEAALAQVNAAKGEEDSSK